MSASRKSSVALAPEVEDALERITKALEPLPEASRMSVITAAAAEYDIRIPRLHRGGVGLDAQGLLPFAPREEAMSAETAARGTCLVCGCTEKQACPGGCACEDGVDGEGFGICSRCVDEDRFRELALNQDLRLAGHVDGRFRLELQALEDLGGPRVSLFLDAYEAEWLFMCLGFSLGQLELGPSPLDPAFKAWLRARAANAPSGLMAPEDEHEDHEGLGIILPGGP